MKSREAGVLIVEGGAGGGAGDHELVDKNELNQVEEAFMASLSGRGNSVPGGQVPSLGGAKAIQLGEASLGFVGNRGRTGRAGDQGSAHLPEVKLCLSSRLSWFRRDPKALQLLS